MINGQRPLIFELLLQMEKHMPSKRSYSNRIRRDSIQKVLMHASNFTLDYAQLNEYSVQPLITKETKDDRENESKAG